MHSKLPLPTLPDALIQAGYETVPYRALWHAAVDRRFPATRAKNGRWAYELADLPAIAEAMGLADAQTAQEGRNPPHWDR